jgi:chemotaxis family two-component system sensor kinase Cph1
MTEIASLLAAFAGIAFGMAFLWAAAQRVLALVLRRLALTAGVLVWLLVAIGLGKDFAVPQALLLSLQCLAVAAGAVAAWLTVAAVQHLKAEQGVADSHQRLQQELLLRETAERHLRRSLADQKRTAADLERFAYSASHDLQAPLRNVAGFAQLLERRHADQLQGEAREFLDQVTTGVQQMQQLIGALLQLSRVGRNGGQFEQRPLAQLLDEIGRTLADQIAAADAEIVYGELPAISGDFKLLAQVFQNLIGNALKFRMPERRPRIEISCRREREDWHIVVADNGIGVPPEQLEQVFAPFRRLHAAEDFEGTGIGLALCRRIVAYHGGQIWAESADEGGRFHLRLPLRPVAGPVGPEA